MLDLEVSDKLATLWERIEEKDGFEIASEAFGNVADYLYDDSYSVGDLLNAGSNIYVDCCDDGDVPLWVFSPSEGDEMLFLFAEKSETKVYNAVLREWCELTDRKIKKSKKK